MDASDADDGESVGGWGTDQGIESFPSMNWGNSSTGGDNSFIIEHVEQSKPRPTALQAVAEYGFSHGLIIFPK